MYFMSIIVASQLKSLNILSLLPPSFLSSFFKQIITVSSILLLYYQFPSCNRLNSGCLGFGLGCYSAQMYLLTLLPFYYNKNIFFKKQKSSHYVIIVIEKNVFQFSIKCSILNQTLIYPQN